MISVSAKCLVNSVLPHAVVLISIGGISITHLSVLRLPTIGITGGVATGKSSATRRFRELGALTFSADEAARAVLSPHNAIVRAISQSIGTEVVSTDGLLDRARLGALIFDNAEARHKLEAILHPPVLRLLQAQIEGAQEDFLPPGMIVVEIPLLYEVGLEGWFDAVVVVTTPLQVQLARLCSRNGLNEAEARQRIASQWPLAQKEARAHTVLPNGGTPEALFHAVNALWKTWTQITMSPNQPLPKK